jgi:uncharacterized protein YkwD
MKHIIQRSLFSLLLLCIHPVQAKNTPMEKEILYHINHYRMTHQLSALTMNDRISQEAARHSQEMAHHRVPFGHQKFNDRMSRLYKTIHHARGGAENVAYNYKNAKVVVQQWLNSPGHRHNIRGNYNLTGIGIAHDDQGRIYYTQIFIRSV